MTRPFREVPEPVAADVRAARRLVHVHLAPTPVVESPRLRRGALLKLETLQPTGSFKVRGALNALGRRRPTERVVTASAGNHALGVAHAAALLGLRATVVLPRTASGAKLRALSRYAVQVLPHGETYDEAEARALELAADGLRFVSPYNDRHVIAGQGTVGLELEEQADGPLTVVCPVGGGGLVSGVALWASTRPGTRVVGVESAGATSMRAALDAGEIVPVPVRQRLADGLGGNLERGSVTFAVVRRLVDDVVVVDDDEIGEAMRFLHETHGLVAEGAGAAAVAALLAGKVAVAGRPVALVTGRNVTERTLTGVLYGRDRLSSAA